MTEAQKQAVLDRGYSRLIQLGGNIYFLVKISSIDGISVQAAVSTMTEYSPQEYADMMNRGGRSVEGPDSRSTRGTRRNISNGIYP